VSVAAPQRKLHKTSEQSQPHGNKLRQKTSIITLGSSTIYLHEHGNFLQGIQVASLMPTSVIRACNSRGWWQKTIIFFSYKML